MQGMVKQTRQRGVLRQEHSSEIVLQGLAGLSGTMDSSRLSMPEVTTSWRSGTAFERALNEGASVKPADYLTVPSRQLGDTGHEFDHQFVVCTTDSPNALLGTMGSGGPFYKGPVVWYPANSMTGNTSGGDGRTTNPNWVSDSFITQLGAGFVNQTSPIKSQANIAQTLIEFLREGLPSGLFAALHDTKGAKKSEVIRAAGSDWLNYIFGVSPLIRDLAKVMKAAERIDGIIRQYVRDDGKAIYRERSARREEPYTKNFRGFMYPELAVPNSSIDQPMLSNNGIRSLGQATVESNTLDTRSAWFTGSFTYYLEELLVPTEVSRFFSSVRGMSPKQIRDMMIKNHVFGNVERPSNALGWELTPFSWLVDWFVNIGVVLDNRRMFDDLGLVMNYGYVMVREERSITTSVTYSNGRTLSSHWQSIRQRRKRANPFGFGIPDAGLSTLQLSVLAALATKLTPRIDIDPRVKYIYPQ